MFRFVRAVFFALPLLLVFMLAHSSQVAAQQLEDVVYLKSGAVVRGIIVEQKPGESISVRTKDGSLFVYKMEEVNRMAKEPVYGTASQGSPSSPSVGYKEPGTATLLSVLCPGCGQIWAGDTKRGAIMLGVGVAAPTIGAIIAASSCDLYTGDCGSGPVMIGLLAALGAWGYGIYDAGPSARRMNASRGMSVALTPGPEKGSLGLKFSIAAP